jgi:hypothetical protein
MRIQFGKLNRTRSRLAIGLITAVILASITVAYVSKPKNTFTAVNLIGVQHIGPNFNIPTFYVDGNANGNVGRGGGGGRGMCCYMLPDKWRPDLSVDVRWEVADWSKELPAELDAGNYRSLSVEGLYRARVPIEKYDKPEDIYVVFFPEGRVRVAAEIFGPVGDSGRILSRDPRAADTATAGLRVADLFSKAELANMDKTWNADKKKYGDWR